MQKVNLQELVLSCIESSDAELRLIFFRMGHVTTRNKEKTQNRRKKHCFGKPKTGTPRAPCLHTFSRISIDIRKTKEKRKLSNFKFSTHIVTDRAENWHTYTTPSGQ